MATLIASANERSFEKELIEAGLHEAICYSIVDLGSQEVEWQGQKKLQRKVMFTFEFVNETREFDGKQKPLVKGIKFTLSMSDKGNLRKQLTSWLSKDPGESFDVMSLLGKSAMIQIVHIKGTDGKIYDNIQNILPSKSTDKAFNELVGFSLTDYTLEEVGKLKEWQLEIITKSPEWKAIQEQVASDSDSPF